MHVSEVKFGFSITNAPVLADQKHGDEVLVPSAVRQK